MKIRDIVNNAINALPETCYCPACKTVRRLVKATENPTIYELECGHKFIRDSNLKWTSA